MSVIVDGSNGLIFNDASTQTTAATGFGFKNRIINGAMVIDQRNAGANTSTGSLTYSVDRWVYYTNLTSKGTWGQNLNSVTPPAGFTKYLGFQSSAATSMASTDFTGFWQAIEGFNIADLAWGTASAQPVTLSFWVRSSLTGTFSGSLRNGPHNLGYAFNYTINSANTWESKSITVAGPTSGTWNVDNTSGIEVLFSMGMGSTYNTTANSWQAMNVGASTGSVNVYGTNGATFYLTGVQLEKGSTATAFDYRDYGRELQMCQRYCVLYASRDPEVIGSGSMWTGTNAWITVRMPVPMRASPTMSCTTGTNYYNFRTAATQAYSTTLLDPSYVGSANLGALIYRDSLGTDLGTGRGVVLNISDPLGKVLYTAEL